MNQEETCPGFLRSDSKCWISSSLFFMSLNRLQLGGFYHLPVGHEFDNDFLVCYTEALTDALLSMEIRYNEKEAYDYVRKVTAILRKWAAGGYSLKVV